jgi:hypothetical protein
MSPLVKAVSLLFHIDKVAKSTLYRPDSYLVSLESLVDPNTIPATIARKIVKLTGSAAAANSQAASSKEYEDMSKSASFVIFQ